MQGARRRRSSPRVVQVLAVQQLPDRLDVRPHVLPRLVELCHRPAVTAPAEHDEPGAERAGRPCALSALARGPHCGPPLVPDVGPPHPPRVPAPPSPPSPPRRHGGHATSTPASSGRVEKKRSTAWSKNSVEARTRVLPVPSVQALNTTSSPP